MDLLIYNAHGSLPINKLRDQTGSITSVFQTTYSPNFQETKILDLFLLKYRDKNYKTRKKLDHSSRLELKIRSRDTNEENVLL